MERCGVTGESLDELELDEVEPAFDGRRERSELKRVMELYLGQQLSVLSQDGEKMRTCSSRRVLSARESVS